MIRNHSSGNNLTVSASEVSVLLSVYNGAKTLKQCLESVCQQTFRNISIICVDDCSTDNSAGILKETRDRFSHIPFTIIQNNENLGLTRSLNRGLATIHLPYTARIDADDRWHPEKLEKQIAFLESHPDIGIVGCNYINVRHGKEKRVPCPETDEDIRRTSIKRNPFAHSAVVFRTEIIRSVGGYDESIRYGQDYELWLRSLPKTKFYNLREYLCYRNAESGISFEKQNAQMIQCMKTQIRSIRKLRRSPLEYRFLLEPLAVLLTPAFIRNFKRKFL